jgi:hypothetical protein
MTPEEAHGLAGEYGLDFAYDRDGRSWSLSLPGRPDGDDGVWIAPHVLDELTPDHFVRHYIKEVLQRVAGGQVAEDD